MKKKILFILITLIIAGFLFFIKICNQGYELSLPEASPQDKYAIDKLSGSSNSSYELNNWKLSLIVKLIKLGVFGKIHSLLIIHNDRLVLEEYFRGWNRDMLHPCFSVTKSITSALIGIALHQGKINGLQEKLINFFPEYNNLAHFDDRKASISLENVLTMTAGFKWNELSMLYRDKNGKLNHENDAVKMEDSNDWIKNMLDRQTVSFPGTQFGYDTGCTILLSGIIKNKTGKSAENYAAENLFKAMGIKDWLWETGPNGISNTGKGLYLHPVDMAMFGYLYLKNGQLNGEQIIPEDWVKESTAEHVTVTKANKYINGYLNYGYHWWQFTDKFFKERWIGTPPKQNDIYIAEGSGGQCIYIIPHLNMVYVSTGYNPDKMWLPGFLFNACLSAIK